MKVLIAGGGTGGHLMPALAIADALVAIRPDVEPVMIGARRGVEAYLLPERRPAYRYHLLPAEPLYRHRVWRNAKWIGALPRLVRACRRILDEEQPAFLVGTGGYAAGPMLFFAGRRGIPFALQEQNAYPGVATRLLSRRAAQIHLGFPEAEGRLRVEGATEVFAFGNPVRPPAVASDEEVLEDLPPRPVCFVMGGSQGSLAINRLVADGVERGLFDDLTLLWSAGNGGWEEFQRYHAPPHRHVRPFWDPISTAYRAAGLVICRAGAMTVAELAVWGLPAVLIPLPTAAEDHQTANAVALESAGCAVHVPQPGLNSHRLSARIHDLMADPNRLTAMGDAARARGKPDAAGRIADQLLRLVG